MSACPEAYRRALLSDETSRVNKLHLAISWAHFHGWHIEWRWKGDPPSLPSGQMRSRLMFQFAPGAAFEEARSFDEDVVPTFKFGKESR